MAQEHHDGREQLREAARNGAATFVLSFLLWAVMLGGTLYFGHSLANWMAGGH